MLRSFCTPLVYHTSLVDLVRDSVNQEKDRGLDVYLQAIFNAVLVHGVSFCSTMSNVVKKHCATLEKDVSSILTYHDGRLAVSWGCASPVVVRRIPLVYISKFAFLPPFSSFLFPFSFRFLWLET